MNCPKCNFEKVIKSGFTQNRNQRYQCKNENCKHIFVDIKNTNRLTDNEKLIIINDLKESIGYRAIARKIGRSLGTVQYFIKKILSNRRT